MKAFSSSLLAECAANPVSERARTWDGIAPKKQVTAGSLLEYENHCQTERNNCLREYYKSLLAVDELQLMQESCGNGFGLVRSIIESSAGLIDMMKSISKSANNGVTGVCLNPYISDIPMDISRQSFEESASLLNCTVKTYTYPESTMLSGDFTCLNKFIEAVNQFRDTLSDLKMLKHDDAIARLNEAQIQFKNLRNELPSLIDCQATMYESTQRLDKYLSKERPWLDSYEEGTFKPNEVSLSGNLDIVLRESMDSLKSVVKSIVIDESITDYINPCILAASYMQRFMETTAGCMQMAVKEFNEATARDVEQMNKAGFRVCRAVRGYAFNEEATGYYESVAFLEDPVAIEESFGKGMTILESENSRIFDEFYGDLDQVMDTLNLDINRAVERRIQTEASIFGSSMSDEEKFQSLCEEEKTGNNLNNKETFGSRVKKAWQKAVAVIKEVFSKFMEKLRANFTTTKHYLDKYKKIILEKPFKADDTYTMQNVDIAIKRIMSTEWPALNFQEMDRPNLGLDNVIAYFGAVASKIATGDIKCNVRDVTDAASMANFWKTWFCLDNHEITYSGSQIQKNMQNYYSFLYDISKIERSINNSIKNIEKNCDAIAKKAGSNYTAPGEGEQPTEEATTVYSYLYDKFFTLSEDGTLIEDVVHNGGGNGTQTGTPANTGAKNLGNDVKNVGAAGEELNRQNDTFARGNDKGIIDTRCKNYVQAASTMLRAKMTACEFFRNDLMTIVRQHVQVYIGKDAQDIENDRRQAIQQDKEATEKGGFFRRGRRRRNKK